VKKKTVDCSNIYVKFKGPQNLWYPQSQLSGLSERYLLLCQPFKYLNCLRYTKHIVTLAELYYWQDHPVWQERILRYSHISVLQNDVGYYYG
jgi:hypothetical protein